MPVPPSVAPLAGLLADLTADLRRGVSCLVVCDKGWTLPIYADPRERLRAAGVRCGYLDGRPSPDTPGDAGIMVATIAQIRWAVRSDMEGIVFALPHLDVMTTSEGGWTNISREVVPLLYENGIAQWLGFRDPTLPLLPVVEKLFTRTYVIDTPYRSNEPGSPTAAPVPTSEPVVDGPSEPTEPHTAQTEEPPAPPSDEASPAAPGD